MVGVTSEIQLVDDGNAVTKKVTGYTLYAWVELERKACCLDGRVGTWNADVAQTRAYNAASAHISYMAIFGK